MKILRITFHRKVKQKATHDISLSKKEYEKLQKGELTQEQIIKNNIGEDFGYTAVGWIETSSESPQIDCEIGSWTTEPPSKK